MASGSKSPMGSMLRMIAPRILGDLDNLPEEQLAGYLDKLLDELNYVRHGSKPQEPLSDHEPRSLGVQSAILMAVPDLTTEG